MKKQLWKPYGFLVGTDGPGNYAAENNGMAGGSLIQAKDGDDHLYSGWGNDILIPGEGHDTLVFGAFDPPGGDGLDLVLGYEPGIDTFDLTAVDNPELAFHHLAGGTLVDYGEGAFFLAGAQAVDIGDFLL